MKGPFIEMCLDPQEILLICFSKTMCMSDASHAYTGSHHKADWEDKLSKPLNDRSFMTIDTGCPKV